MSGNLYCRRSSNCQPMHASATGKSDKKEAIEDKGNDTPPDDTVTEPVEVPAGEASTSDSTPIDVKKLSSEPSKTVGAIWKTQKAKQREIIETKMLSMLTEDKQDDAIDLAFAAISKMAKVELNDKKQYKFIDGVNALYATFSKGEVKSPEKVKPVAPVSVLGPLATTVQCPDQFLFAGGMMPSNPAMALPVNNLNSGELVLPPAVIGMYCPGEILLYYFSDLAHSTILVEHDTLVTKLNLPCS